LHEESELLEMSMSKVTSKANEPLRAASELATDEEKQIH
jgi:hypothetical protein